jgi:hypothetical protein
MFLVEKEMLLLSATYWKGNPLTHRKNAEWQTWKIHVVFYDSADAGDGVDK